MCSSGNYYEKLGLDCRATFSDVKERFKTLSLSLHPDKCKVESEKYKEITEAYRILSDPERRGDYDFILLTQGDNANNGGSSRLEFMATYLIQTIEQLFKLMKKHLVKLLYVAINILALHLIASYYTQENLRCGSSVAVEKSDFAFSYELENLKSKMEELKVINFELREFVNNQTRELEERDLEIDFIREQLNRNLSQCSNTINTNDKNEDTKYEVETIPSQISSGLVKFMDKLSYVFHETFLGSSLS